MMKEGNQRLQPYTSTITDNNYTHYNHRL